MAPETKVRRLEIVLTNPQVVYFPGQYIQGHVFVELNEDMQMRGVRAELLGKGFVYWTEGTGDDSRSYYETETYVDTTLILFGQDSSSNSETVFPAGNHVFPFQFVLPLGIPGSFELDTGCFVRYSVKAIIYKQKKVDLMFKMVITVGSVLDLNTDPNAMNPQQCTDSKTVCCCCCESSPVSATFRTDKTGYVPGEPIICNAEITEGSGRGIHSSKVKLIMKTTTKAHGSFTMRINQIAILQHGAIPPGGTDVWNGEQLIIPPVPPSYLPECNVINIDYIVELSIDIAGSPRLLCLPVPIVIGTIPAQSVVSQYMPHLLPNTRTNQPLGIQAPVNFDLPPPTYRESILGKVDTIEYKEKHSLVKHMLFAPVYPYYDWMSRQGMSAST